MTVGPSVEVTNVFILLSSIDERAKTVIERMSDY